MEEKVLTTHVRGIYCRQCPEWIVDDLLHTRGVLDAAEDCGPAVISAPSSHHRTAFSDQYGHSCPYFMRQPPQKLSAILVRKKVCPSPLRPASEGAFERVAQRGGCDIGRTTYAKYEAGERNVRVSVLLALKKLYGCPFDAFFAGFDTADDAEA